MMIIKTDRGEGGQIQICSTSLFSIPFLEKRSFGVVDECRIKYKYTHAC